MRKINNLILIIFVLSFALPLSALAIGQVTKPIIIENILRDSQVTKILDLFNSENEEIFYGLKTEGEIADWVSFYKIDDINLENSITEIQVPAESYVKAIVKFTVPSDAPNGEYSGKVYIFTTPTKNKDTGEMSITVGQRIGREVSIIVTDEEILDFNTFIIPLKYGVGKNEPLKIKVIYNNQGNVSIKPDIQLKITQINTGKVVQSTVIYPYPENENPVRPFERKVFENLIEWPTDGKDNGRYLAELKVLLNNEVIKETDFRFQVGFDWSKLFASIAIIGGGNLTLAWFIIGGILAIIAGILTVFYKKPKFLKIGIKKIKTIF
ncbi:hypothetical protein KAW43_03605 [Candidatus Parcubacteria bacterium]|nr:hypothetical protein [Candidatus Parcubacteria bacterium]